MGAAHFVLVGYSSAREESLGEWLAASALVEGIHTSAAREISRGELSPAGPVVGWRMIASNGRELARSVGVFGSEEEAEHSLSVMRAAAALLELHPVAARSPRRVGWCGTAEGLPLLMSARWYESRAVARNAGDLTLRTLRDSRDTPIERRITARAFRPADSVSTTLPTDEERGYRVGAEARISTTNTSVSPARSSSLISPAP